MNTTGMSSEEIESLRLKYDSENAALSERVMRMRVAGFSVKQMASDIATTEQVILKVLAEVEVSAAGKSMEAMIEDGRAKARREGAITAVLVGISR